MWYLEWLDHDGEPFFTGPFIRESDALDHKVNDVRDDYPFDFVGTVIRTDPPKRSHLP